MYEEFATGSTNSYFVSTDSYIQNMYSQNIIFLRIFDAPIRERGETKL